jgi:hypothetical protein
VLSHLSLTDQIRASVVFARFAGLGEVTPTLCEGIRWRFRVS